ncbi:TonB-dependent receptor [Rhodothalassium salexigens]|uniref:TonB-dependent receptor n=1 Tax=Rhodothalassium salexigens TaxID=1086 RepID=UPI001911438E|nr:TonB-dependent receptor [Rhodothalassium salexigens]MBK5910716.1 TonB-dependent receptor [Rhodothalassium salexigens]MBK5921654.1 TonB-dependent receptor [Rhodothalassium salexigens]
MSLRFYHPSADGTAVRRAGFCVSLSVLALAAPAQAQTEDRTSATPARTSEDSAQGTGVALEEIIVTAQRREQSQLDVPISVTAFSQGEIQRRNFQGVDDYFAVTPNVSFTSTGSRDRKSLSIRGVTNQLSPDNNIRPQTFGFYIDDFNVAAGTANPQIVDIQRIEILRGPQGTYFGRNAVGGAINITTNQPSQDLYAQGSVEYARFDTVDFYGIFNTPVVEDVAAVRFVGRYRESDGNIRNVNPIGGGNDSEYKYGKGSVRLTPTDRLTVDFTAAYTDEVVGMREGIPSGVLAPFSQNLYGGIVDGAIPDEVGFWPENTNRVNFNRPQEVGTEFYYLTGRVRYDAEHFTVTSISGYIDSKTFLQGDIDGSSLDLFFETKPIERDSLSQELRVQSYDNRWVDWTVGLFAARDRGNTEQETFAGADNPFGLPEDFQVTSSFSDAEVESYAAFGEAVVHITDRLDLTAGGRFTYEKQDIRQFNTSAGQINNLVEDDTDFTDFSPRISVSYAWADALTSYATVSRGFKAGGVQINPDLDDTAYAPEILWNYEIGLKGEFFDRRLRVNTALFYMDWNDLQTEFAFGVVDENDVISFFSGIENAASARSLGAELEVQALITPHLTLGGGVGFLDAQFQDYDDAFVEGQIVDLSGERMPNAPRWTLNGVADYSRPLFGDTEGYIRAEWFFRSSMIADKRGLIFEGFPWEVPSFHNVNLRAGLTRGRYQFQAYIENLLDANYYTNAYEKAFIGGVHLEPSFQTFGFRFTVTFE